MFKGTSRVFFEWALMTGELRHCLRRGQGRNREFHRPGLSRSLGEFSDKLKKNFRRKFLYASLERWWTQFTSIENYDHEAVLFAWNTISWFFKNPRKPREIPCEKRKTQTEKKKRKRREIGRNRTRNHFITGHKKLRTCLVYWWRGFIAGSVLSETWSFIPDGNLLSLTSILLVISTFLAFLLFPWTWFVFQVCVVITRSPNCFIFLFFFEIVPNGRHFHCPALFPFQGLSC